MGVKPSVIQGWKCLPGLALGGPIVLYGPTVRLQDSGMCWSTKDA